MKLFEVHNVLSAYHYCYHSVGVVQNERKIKFLSTCTDPWPVSAAISTSYFDGHSNYWEANVILTVKLNCDEWIVEYYLNKQLEQTDKIEANKPYFFAMNSCGSSDNRFRIVETPTELYQD